MLQILYRILDPRGRAGRAEYWLILLTQVTVALILRHLPDLRLWPVTLFVLRFQFTITLTLTLLSLIAGIRRLHDSNRGGAWMLILLPTVLAWATVWLNRFIIQQSYFGNARAAWGLLTLLYSPAGMVVQGAITLATVASLIAWIVLMCQKGSPDRNRFGPVPASPFPFHTSQISRN